MILLVGASGRLGSVVAELLLAQGKALRAMTRTPLNLSHLKQQVAEGDTVWAELHYHGMQTDGKQFTIRGVTLSRIQANQITWTRLYIEEVKELHRGGMR